MSSKDVLIFPKYLLNFKSDTIQKQTIINLISYSSKDYASVVLCDSEIALLGEWDDVVICPFLYCLLFIHHYLLDSLDAIYTS